MCLARTVYCWTFPSFGVSFGQPSFAASAVESENILIRKARWSVRYSMRAYVQAGFLAHLISGARLSLGKETALPSRPSFGFARLFLGGIAVGKLIFSWCSAGCLY